MITTNNSNTDKDERYRKDDKNHEKENECDNPGDEIQLSQKQLNEILRDNQTKRILDNVVSSDDDNIDGHGEITEVNDSFSAKGVAMMQVVNSRVSCETEGEPFKMIIENTEGNDRFSAEEEDMIELENSVSLSEGETTEMYEGINGTNEATSEVANDGNKVEQLLVEGTVQDLVDDREPDIIYLEFTYYIN